MNKKVAKYLIALTFIALVPMVGYAQTEGTTYIDTSNPVNTQGLTFTVTQKQTGLQDLLNVIIGGVQNVLGVNVIDIDLGTLYQATITGPKTYAGALNIPATVWDANNFNADSDAILSLIVNNYSGLNLGVLNNIPGLTLALSTNSGVALELLQDVIHLNILPGNGTTTGIPVVAIGHVDDTSVNEGAFEASYIESVDFSNAKNLTMIGGRTFMSCKNMKGGLDFSGAVKLSYIGFSSFHDCIGLDGTIKFPVALQHLGFAVFYGCSNLTGGIDLSKCSSLTTLGEDTYNIVGGDNTLGDVNGNCFWGCSSLTGNISLPSSLTSIGSSTFSGCSGLTGDVVIPAGVTLLSGYAFNNCSSLRSITINSLTINSTPAKEGVGTGFGTSIFTGCDGLEYIDMSAGTIGKVPTSLDRISTSSSFFAGLSDHTVVYLPIGVTDAMMPTGTDNVNYVRLDQSGTKQCTLLSIEDGENYFLPHSFTAANSVYNRTFAATSTNASSMYLPFDFTLPTGMTAYKLGRFKSHDVTEKNDNTFVFYPVSGTLNANTPYIVVGSGQVVGVSGQTIQVSAAGIGHDEVSPAAENPVDGSPNDKVWDKAKVNAWKLCGSMESTTTMAVYLGETWNYQSTWGSKTTYVLDQNNVWNYAGNTGVVPMRAFIAQTDGTAGAAMGKIAFANSDGTVTGIDSINSEQVVVNSVESRIYTINGQYVGKDFNSLPKGIYIVNGAKRIKN